MVTQIVIYLIFLIETLFIQMIIIQYMILLTLLLLIIDTKSDILNEKLPESFFASILVIFLFWTFNYNTNYMSNKLYYM